MAHVKRSYMATETVVQWVLGTKPGGRYFGAVSEVGGDLAVDIRLATKYPTDKAAKEALALGVPVGLRPKLRVIRVSRTTRESCDE